MIPTVPFINVRAGLTAGDLKRALHARLASPPSPPPASVLDNAFVMAACVMHVFEPVAIQPFGTPSTEADRRALLELSAPTIGWPNQRYRSLLADVRQQALDSLGARSRMQAALWANPDRERTSVQDLFEAWLSGELNVETLQYRRLEDLRELYSWNLARLGGLPAPDCFERLRVRRARTGLFGHLVDEAFVGRGRELLQLRAHVGVAPSSSWARFRAFVATPTPPPPLVVYGPGGIGKSALVGAFLIEHVERSDDAWFPFAYLAFDNELLDVREPWTLLAAASEQIASQVSSPSLGLTPELARAFERFRGMLGAFREERASVLPRAASLSDGGERVRLSRSADLRLYDAFARLLENVIAEAERRQNARGVPLVLVLDTFEEVLYRPDEDLIGLWEILSVLQLGCPAVRIIIAGRGKPRPFAVAGRAPLDLLLGDLREEDALLVLARLGIRDAALRRIIAVQIGGSPLSLRLAARAAQEETVGAGGFDWLRTRRLLFMRLSPEIIRGQLYRRILDHIHDPDVAQLAHPGMVLRRVTSEIIERVLAPVCGLGSVDGAQAERLFAELQREHALVRLDDDASLRYREEVRTPMLQLLKADQPDKVKALHEAIAAFYAEPRVAEPKERAEELYHRMMLEEDADTLRRRWLPGVERYLASAIPELPPLQLVWLAQHMSIELSPELQARANQAEWERVVGSRVLELVRYNLPKAALELLRERSGREPDSSLFAIEIRTHTLLGDNAAAFELSRKAAEGWPIGNRARLAEVLWLGAQAGRRAALDAKALAILRDVEVITSELPDGVPALQALTELVAWVPEEEKEAKRMRLAAALDRLNDGEIDRERSLVRLACVRLGPGYPRSILRVLPLVLSDFTQKIARDEVDIRPVLQAAMDVLRRSDDDNMKSLGRRIATMSPARPGPEIVTALVDIRSGTSLPALLILMSAEAADLGAATLGGLDAYREDFEARAAPEATA